MKKLLILAFSITIFFSFVRLSEADAWKEKNSRHFIIYYNKATEDIISSVLDAAEQNFEEITGNLGYKRYKGRSWEAKIKIYIYDDAEQYVNVANQARWSHGSAKPEERTIRTFPAAHGFFDSTLPHELGHIIFREFVGMKTVVPLWFEEGVAMYQEKAKRWGANKVVKEAILAKVFIPLEQLSQIKLDANSDQNLVQLFYLESASVMYFLIHEQGTQRFVHLSKRLSEGVDFEEALKEVYHRYNNIKELNQAWVKYIRQ